MKIAVTDACIFIDLHELQLTEQFFGLDIEVHTSIDIINELYYVQQQVLAAYRSVKKLTVHNLKEEDIVVIQQKKYPKSLSDSDKSVLFIAEKLNAMLISSDKTVRNTAKNNAIPYHGMIWIFDALVKHNLITKAEASAKLKQLILTNIVFQNNRELVAEMDKRLKQWLD